MLQLDDEMSQGRRKAYLVKQQSWYAALGAISECLNKVTNPSSSHCATERTQLERAEREKTELDAQMNRVGADLWIQLTQKITTIRSEYPSCR